ncbi:hypothetical protein B0H65DRAFT_429578 [Neurospora tetraspora]|uniref:Uncharacterized protein n=1 Tax=Neurospora tetraspora TaxID=94610 RepID=A0AAE0JBW7_9PEZI|nr:hypothetical protein B0H65DRAFT_429578 [Neurospora tetraspora]
MADSGPRTPLRDDNNDDEALGRIASPCPLLEVPVFLCRHDNHRDDDRLHDASTQPLSSPISNEPREDDRENIDTEPIDSHDITDDVDVSTASSSSDDETHCKIDLRNRSGVITWEDASHQDRQTSDLCIDLYVDTEKRQAVFALHGFFFFKNGGSKAYLSLVIHPENVQSVDFSRSHPPTIPTVSVHSTNDFPNESFASLCVTMTQPPNIMVPKDRCLEPKPRYQAILDAIASLSSVQRFTIYLPDLSQEIQQELALLPSVFSSAYPFGRLRTDETWAPPIALYEYTFQKVIDLVKTPPISNGDSNQKLEELQELVGDGIVAAPPYPQSGSSQRTVQSIGPSSRKRRASSDMADKDSHAGSSILGYQTPETGPQPPLTMSASLASPVQLSTPCACKRQRTTELLSPVTNADIVSALRQLSDRVSQLETRFDQFSPRLDSLESLFAAHYCRYDTEEADHVFGTIEERIEHVEGRIDYNKYELDRELEETVKLEAEERVAEEVKLQHEELREELGTEWTEDLRREVAEQVTSEVEEKTKREVTREVVKGIAEALMGAYLASQVNQDGSSSTPFDALRATAMPGETALRAAVEDIQNKYKDELGKEMTEVLNLLEENPLKAVTYNACGEETRREYVMKWKAAVLDRGVFRPIWR